MTERQASITDFGVSPWVLIGKWLMIKIKCCKKNFILFSKSTLVHSPCKIDMNVSLNVKKMAQCFFHSTLWNHHELACLLYSSDQEFIEPGPVPEGCSNLLIGPLMNSSFCTKHCVLILWRKWWGILNITKAISKPICSRQVIVADRYASKLYPSHWHLNYTTAKYVGPPPPKSGTEGWLTS